MDTTRRQRNCCVSCGTMMGVFSCRGCTKNFCLRHTTEHRDVLQKSMNEIVHNYELLKRNLKGQSTEEFQQSLMDQVELWEHQSIEKIRQLAEETRSEVITTVRYRTDDLKEKLEQLKKQLDQAQVDGGFYENDLKNWTERLNQLQQTFVKQQTIKIDENSGSSSFISRISLSDLSDTTYRREHRIEKQHVYDEVHQNQFDLYSSTQDHNEYSTGKHRLRFKIERFESYSSILFGIISRDATKAVNPFRNPTFYGWAEKNLVYRGGNAEQNFEGYNSDFQNDDIYTFIIDCEQEKISLTNERTNRSYHLGVDVDKCPFPWQLNVRLYNHQD